MRIKIVLLLVVILFFQNPVFAKAATIGEKVVGKTIKAVVRIVVATTSIENTKKKLVKKLELMDDEKFRLLYDKSYKLLKDLHPDIKATYKITLRMTREQMIKNIESADKKQIYKIISSISDETLAGLFKEYLGEMRHIDSENRE